MVALVVLVTRPNSLILLVNWFCSGPTSVKFLGILFMLSATSVVKAVSPCSKVEESIGYPFTMPGRYTL